MVAHLVLLFVVLGTIGVTAAAFFGAVTLVRTRPASRRQRRVSVVSLVLFAIGFVTFLYGSLIERKDIEITRQVVETAKLPAGSRLRIAHLSDLHLDDAAVADRIAGLVNAEHADVLVFTGDALNDEDERPAFERMLASIDAPFGRYAVRGNHDTGRWRVDDWFGPVTRELGRTPVTLVDGAVTLCGGGWYGGGDLLACARKASGFTIVAFHTPDRIEAVAETGRVDLYLAGHTHGGQVRLPWFGAAMTGSTFGKKYEMGRYQVGRTTLYVNRGIGVSPLPAPPVRILCRPEIAIIDVVGAPVTPGPLR